MRVAFFSTKSYDTEFFNALKAPDRHEFTYFETQLNRQTVNLLGEGSYDAVCVFVNDKLLREVLADMAERGIRLVALRCTGFNNVDLEAAAEHDIKVVRVPAYFPYGVAEFAVAMILTLNRKTHKAYNRVRESNFSLERLIGFDLYGKTVGVIGTGKIGECFANIMLGFGCQVVATDPYPNEALLARGVEYVELPALLGASDIVSLHCPLMRSTQYLINRQTLSQMKRGAMLVNSSRGGLLDTTAVIDALRSRHLGYLAIDVYEQEENLFFEDLSENILDDEQITTLMSFPNVLVTAHQSFFTREAMREITLTTIGNLDAFEEGGELEHSLFS